MEYPPGVLDQVCELTNLVATKSVHFKKAFSSCPASPPGSPPPLIDRFIIDVKSGVYAVSVLAMVDESSADIIVLEDKVGLIEEALDKAGPPDGDRLVHQLTWIINTMEVACHDDNMKAFIDVLRNSVQLDLFSSYEVKIDENIVTFFIKKVLPPLEFNGLFQLTKKNKLGGGGENDFTIKIELNKNTGETLTNRTQVIFSPRIKLLMPNFSNSRVRNTIAQDLSGEQFGYYLVQIGDTISDDLEKAKAAWEQRANFSVSIYKNMKPQDIITVNGEKMNVLNIYINTDVFKAIVKITLDDNFPKIFPTYSFKVTVEGTSSRDFKWNASSISKIHKKKPFEDGWSIEEMAAELVEAIPGFLEFFVGKIIEDAIEKAEKNQPEAGDSAYPISEVLMKPFSTDEAANDTEEVDEDEDE